MDNIQTEMLEIEFLTYSKGMTTISEEDFARILLRYTNVEDIRSYLENVRQCIPDEKVMSNRTFMLNSFKRERVEQLWQQLPTPTHSLSSLNPI